jgi:hypothetical protein
MYEQKEKLKDNKSRSVANSVRQKKNEMKQGFSFVDNRSTDVTQLRVSNENGTSEIIQRHWWKQIPQKMWNSQKFNNVYNPYMKLLYGQQKVFRGMDQNQLRAILETGKLQSKAQNARPTQTVGEFGQAGREQHLKSSYAPPSQYVSTINPNEIDPSKNTFGDIQVPLTLVNRGFKADSKEKQTLFEGGTEVLNVKELLDNPEFNKYLKKNKE